MFQQGLYARDLEWLERMYELIDELRRASEEHQQHQPPVRGELVEAGA